MSNRCIIQKHQKMYKSLFKNSLIIDRYNDNKLDNILGFTHLTIRTEIDCGYCLDPTSFLGYKVPNYLYSKNRKSRLRRVPGGIGSGSKSALEHIMGREIKSSMFKENRPWFSI